MDAFLHPQSVFMKICIYVATYLFLQVCLLFVLSIEILMGFFLKVTFGGIIHRAIATTTASCYLYYQSYSIRKLTDIFLGDSFQNEKHS